MWYNIGMEKSNTVQGKGNAEGRVVVYDKDGNLRVVDLSLGNDGQLRQTDGNFHPRKEISEHFFATLGISLGKEHSEERDLNK